jgi:signal transduction histidine kinase
VVGHTGERTDELAPLTDRGQQAVLRAIIESPPGIVIFALDREYRYLAFNDNHARTMSRIWGVTIHIGDSMLDLIGRGDDREKALRNFDRALAGESFSLIEEYGDELKQRRIYENVYSPITVDQGGVIGLTVYLSDVTAQRRAQIELEAYRNSLEELVHQRTEELQVTNAKLLHAQKLESLGVLAAGIAHDFNTLLAVILGRAELAAPLLAHDSPAREHLEIVRESALEGRMLTKQLLGYSGKGVLSVQYVDLGDLVRSMMPLLRASVPPAIALTFDVSNAPVVSELDATQVRQLVLNLVKNACDAIGDDSGEIAVRTRLVMVDEALLRDACMPTSVTHGLFACIEVQDNGAGMDEVVRSKIFDPFYTTKNSGRGLGLAAAFGTVTSHHGTILLRTAPGEGSLFSVLFPAITPESHG